MKRSGVWILAGLALALLLVFFFTGGTRTKARRFDEEPMVRVTVDAETGETRSLPMEEYIKGVVAGEMGRLPAEGGREEDWPHEAYAAQAILARSFALNFLNDEGVVEISTDVTEAQAYAPENISEAISKAVDSTRGEVMVHAGDFVRAWFHSYSGGHTATAEEGLNHEGEPGFIKAVKLPENRFAPEDRRSWTASIPLARLSAALRERGVDVGEISDVRIVERGPSGRATTLEIRGSGGTREMHAAEFRLAADPTVLKSTLFDRFTVEAGRLSAAGRGFGHGVGLSQWDAYQMARDGQKAEEILNNFFQRITIEKAWD